MPHSRQWALVVDGLVQAMQRICPTIAHNYHTLVVQMPHILAIDRSCTSRPQRNGRVAPLQYARGHGGRRPCARTRNDHVAIKKENFFWSLLFPPCSSTVWSASRSARPSAKPQSSAKKSCKRCVSTTESKDEMQSAIPNGSRDGARTPVFPTRSPSRKSL